MKTRLVLADDHKLFLEGLRALLAHEPEFEIIGEARNGHQALALARKLEPDLVLMDLSMPELNGVEATRRICKTVPKAKVLCLSMHNEPRFVEAALEAGAAGYLLKDSASEELLTAIRAVSNGKNYVSPAIAGVLVEAMRRRSTAGASAFEQLTAREREVLQLIAEGHSTKQIASRLDLSAKTIGSHREHVMQKLGIRSVAGLTKYALREGLTTHEIQSGS